MNNNKIKEFKGKHRFLSNFWKSYISYGGIYYPTTEHAYQASKTHDIQEKYNISNMENPADAKKYSRNLVIRDNWNKIKVNIMYEINIIKYVNNTNLGNQLIDTYPMILQEGNEWEDTFWGIDLKTGKGNNMLGKILMNIRKKLMRFTG